MEKLWLIVGVLTAVTMAHPHDNMFWQYANWTARQYTSESCYVCRAFPTSAEQTSLKTVIQPANKTVAAMARVCRTERCYNDTRGSGQHRQALVATSAEAWCKQVLAFLLKDSRDAGIDMTECLEGYHWAKDRDERKQYRITDWKPRRTGKFSVCVKQGLDNEVGLGRVPHSQCDQTYTECDSKSNENTTDCSAVHPGKEGTQVLPDWYWVCGKKVYLYLPRSWTGQCALTQFADRFLIVSRNPKGQKHHHISKRSGSDDNFPPPKHRLKSKTTKFFEALFPQVGVAELWNYMEVVHFRLATFINATDQAVEGVKAELTAIRLMVMQNRMVLDIITAKEGGVCHMVGDTCCTYIPENDEDEGEIGQALGKMKAVADKMKRDETGNVGWGLWYNMFGQWAPYLSLVVPVLAVISLMCVFGPCVVKCLQSSISKQVSGRASYQLLRAERDKYGDLVFPPGRMKGDYNPDLDYDDTISNSDDDDYDDIKI